MVTGQEVFMECSKTSYQREDEQQWKEEKSNKAEHVRVVTELLCSYHYYFVIETKKVQLAIRQPK